jgi:hypothetical protein
MFRGNMGKARIEPFSGDVEERAGAASVKGRRGSVRVRSLVVVRAVRPCTGFTFQPRAGSSDWSPHRAADPTVVEPSRAAESP